MVAGRVGQLVNYASLSDDVGVSSKTIESWLSILEASYIIHRLQPYYKNFGKRVIKSPKIYFYDVGLLCYLLGIDSVEELQTHYAYGQIFENLVLTEVHKILENTRRNEKLYFWRDSHHNEVDLVIDTGNQLHAIEVKSSRTYNQDMLKGLARWHALNPTTNKPLTLVYAGSANQSIGEIQLKKWETFLSELLIKISS